MYQLTLYNAASRPIRSPRVGLRFGKTLRMFDQPSFPHNRLLGTFQKPFGGDRQSLIGPGSANDQWRRREREWNESQARPRRASQGFRRNGHSVSRFGHADELAEMAQFHASPSMPIGYTETSKTVFPRFRVRMLPYGHDGNSKSKRTGPRGTRVARQLSHVQLRRLLRPAMDGLPQPARDQRRSRHAGKGFRNSPPSRYGNHHLCPQRRARAQGFDGQRPGDPPGRGPIHGRRHRRAAQRIQSVEGRGGAFAPNLDPARP